MFFTLLTLVTALAIAGTAAWFSIIGLMSIFSASTIPILIMGSVLEVGKLVTASWVYRNWKTTGFLLKTYLTISVVILMFITSMGIFGFLSKAHLDQASPVGNNIAKIERIDLRIQRSQREIDDAEKIVSQLDEAVNTLIKFEKISGSTGAIAIRKSQNDERQALKAIVEESQKTIDGLVDEKFELSAAVREVEIEVGPVRYVAELIYDDASDKIDDAVRWVILILVVVFDPLAVLLLIAANQSLVQVRNEKEKRSVEEPDLGSENAAVASAMGDTEPQTTPVSAVSNESTESSEALNEEIEAPAQRKSQREKVDSSRPSGRKAVSDQIQARPNTLLREEIPQTSVPSGSIDGTPNKKKKTQRARKNSQLARGSANETSKAVSHAIQEKQSAASLDSGLPPNTDVSKDEVVEVPEVQKKDAPKTQNKKVRGSSRNSASNKSKATRKKVLDETPSENRSLDVQSAKIKDGIEPDKVRSPNWISNKRD